VSELIVSDNHQPKLNRVIGLAVASACVLFAASAWAEGLGATVEGGVTVTYQYADDSRLDDEVLGSADLVATVPAGPGEWVIYVEGSATPNTAHVSQVLGEANGDAGSALDRDGKGRVQVSELHYVLPLDGASLTIGLMDTKGFLDSSEVANDETAQFLGTTLVNNPTIEFPDYTLGAAYHHEPADGGVGMVGVLVGSHGLADNPNRSYSQLVDVGDNGKGVFAAGELYWPRSNRTYRFGVWVNSKDHAKLDGSAGSESNYGAYAVADGAAGKLKWNLRLGAANDKVSQAATFAGIAFEYPVMGSTLGAGLTHTGASSKLGSSSDDTVQAEIYARFDLSNSLHITPSVQWLENSGFDKSGTSFDNDMFLAALRLSYLF